MYSLIISIPLTTSIIILIFGRKLGIKGIKILTIINMSKTIMISIIYLIKIISKSQYIFHPEGMEGTENKNIERIGKLPNQVEYKIIKIYNIIKEKILYIFIKLSNIFTDIKENNKIGERNNKKGKIEIGEWINIDQIEEKYKIEISKITIIMTTLIIIISFCIIIYSFWYLEIDAHINRFISYLLLFTTSMLILVNSSNILLLFLGWESVGITSYLLINYWYNNINSNKSAIKAILYNKIGDISLLIFMFILLLISPNTYFSSSLISNSYNLINNLNNINWIEINENIKIINNLLFFILFAIMAKSSQFFLHPWLGDAMAGPTPVSALLHAATMVTAGIYLMIRLEFIFNIPKIIIFPNIQLNLNLSWIEYIILNIEENIKIIYLLIGILTLFLGSLSSSTQYDIKKIIAYSTASQLAYMFIANSINLSNISLFHLITHGFFKALLFLTAGLIIHNIIYLEQDIRKYGSLNYYLPFASILLLISSFSLSSLPFLSGFYSKELIIQSSFIFNNPFLFLFLSFGAFLTFFYSIRLFKFSFLSFPNYFISSFLPLKFNIINSSLIYNNFPILFNTNLKTNINKKEILLNPINRVEGIEENKIIIQKNEINNKYKIIFIILTIGSISIGYILSDYFSSYYLFIFHFFNFNSIYYTSYFNFNLRNNFINLIFNQENYNSLSFFLCLSLPILFFLLLSLYYILKLLLFNIIEIQYSINIFRKINKYRDTKLYKRGIEIFRILFIISNRRIFIDTIINIISNKLLSFFYYFYKTFDSGFIEFFSPNSLFLYFYSFPNFLSSPFSNKFNINNNILDLNNNISGDFFIYLLFSFSFLLLLILFY